MSAPERGLTAEQLEMLLRPLHPNRVREHKGQSHVEAWDVRRWLTRIFGFGGWSDEILSCECIHAVTSPIGNDPNPLKHRCTAVYRVTMRLTVKDPQGNVVGSWEDGATGEGINQVSVGDAHDLALKAALSQALKRCAVNLGDQFGLGLYNDGSLDPAVIRTLGHPATGRPVDEMPPEDAPVVGGDLDDQAGEQQHDAPPAAQPDVSFWDTDEGRRLLKTLHTLIAVKYGPKTDEERHQAFTKFTGREITSAKQLTAKDAEAFIASLRKQPDYVKPQPKQAADGNENFRQAEELLKLEQNQGPEETDLESELLEEIEGSGSRGDLAAVMSVAMAARDKGTLTGEQYKRLADAADAHAARASKQHAGSGAAR